MTKDLSMETLCGGAVRERLNRALRKVADNVLDPNTEAKKKREISLKIVFTPNEDDREDVGVDVAVTMKLAPEEGVHTQLYVQKNQITDTVTISEHAKGEIKGQISFDDLGMAMSDKDDEPTAEELGCDPETGEIKEEAKPQKSVVDFRALKAAEG